MSDTLTGVGYVSEIDYIKPVKTKSFKNHSYYVYDVNISQQMASAYCKSKGGYLASIDNREESDMIDQLIQSGNNKAYFIGLEKKNKIWFTSTGKQATFFNWESSQPDNHLYNQYYARIYRDIKKWDDTSAASLDQTNGFIMEKPPASLITPSIKIKKTIKKVYSKKSFKLHFKTNSNGRVSYKSNNNKIAKVLKNGYIRAKKIGIVKITMTIAKSNKYKQLKKTIKLKIIPPRGKIKKISRINGRRIRVKWKTFKKGSGYILQICGKKKFKKGVLQRYFKKKQSSISVPLKKRKKHFIRVRIYKKLGDSQVFGKWSKVKKIRT